jgi:hypothetical protein
VVGPAPGGIDLASPITATAIVYDPIAQTAAPAFGFGLTSARRGMALGTIANDGRSIVAGGRDANGAAVPGLERVSP